MKRLRTFTVVGMMIAFFISATAGALSADQTTITLGFSPDSLPGFNRNDLQAAMKVWIETVITEQNLQNTAEIIMYDSFSELQRDWHAEKIHSLTLTAQDLDQLGVAPEAIYANVQGDDVYRRYVIIARRDSNVSNLQGLKGRTLAFAEGYDMSLARPWLDSLLMDQTGSALTDWLAAVVPAKNASESVLKTFFKQADAALLSLDAFQVAAELNPQLSRDLVVLYQSPPFIPSFNILHPAWKEASRQSMEEGIGKLHTTPAGEQVLIVFQSSRMKKMPFSALKETLAFLHHYRNQQQQAAGGLQP